MKGSREKNSRSKFFVVWAFNENLTRGENVEEYGRDWCIRGCHVITKSGSSYWSSYTMMAGVLANFSPNSQTILPVWPMLPTDALRMASSTSRFAAAIAKHGIEDDNEHEGRLLRYQEDCYGIRKTVMVFHC